MAGSFLAGMKAARTQLIASTAADRAAACATITTLLVNGNGRDLPMIEIVLPDLLSLARTDAVAMVPLATAAQGLWATHAYPESLVCLEATMPFVAPTTTALSRRKRPWDDWSIPYTRVRELALDGLWRFEALLALGRFDEAEALRARAIEDSACLPSPFELSASIHEWGDAEAFVLRARIRATRALRKRAAGSDACAFRKLRKQDLPSVAESARLLGLARRVSDSARPALDAFLPTLASYAAITPGTLSVDEKRRLGAWRAEGHAEAGLLARDAGDVATAQHQLALAHRIAALVDPGLRFIDPEYHAAIQALAPQPAPWA